MSNEDRSSEEDSHPLSAHGAYDAFEPQFLDGDKWKRVPTERLNRPLDIFGVPYPEYMGELTSFIGLFGEEQAQSIAYMWAARGAEHGYKVNTRIKKYRVSYDIAAYPYM